MTLANHPYAGAPVQGIATDTILLVYTKQSGSDWFLYSRTSTDFVTWTAESQMSVAGLTSTDTKRNAFLMQLEGSGDLWVFFEVVESVVGVQELTNIYYTVSSDYGTTWGTAVKFTSYTSLSVVAEHPYAVQKGTDSMHIIFNEKRNALTMDRTAAGWCAGADVMAVSDMHWSVSQDRLYVTLIWSGGGVKKLNAVVEIDVDNWVITRCWSDTSTPAFENEFAVGDDATKHVWYNTSHGEENFVTISMHSTSGGECHIAVLNTSTNTITQYNFNNQTAFEWIKNVNWTDQTPLNPIWSRGNVWIDSINSRMYVTIINDIYYDKNYHVGYIDLTAAGPEYTFTTVISDDIWTDAEIAVLATAAGEGNSYFYPSEDFIIASSAALAAFTGRLKIYNLSTGGIYKDYTYLTNATFPYHGLRSVLLKSVGGRLRIYGGFAYTTSAGQTDFRGLCRITLDDDSIEFYRPTFATRDEYDIRNIIDLDNDTIAMTSGSYGIHLFDVNNTSWTVYNELNTPGLTIDGSDVFSPGAIAYDASRGMIYAGDGITWSGITAISRFGALKRSYYIQGANTTSWTWQSELPLVIGQKDYDAAAAVDPDSGGLYVFWVNDTLGDLSIKWDFEIGSLSLSNYISKEHEIVLQRTIDGTPARLSFTVSHGHLFDQHNINSILAFVLSKFRKITLRFGELSLGINYWKTQGTFIIVETTITYQRGTYPILSIVCEDKMSSWDEHMVIATDFYETEPESVLSNMLINHTDFSTGDINIASMNNKEDVVYQWIESSVASVLLQVCNRFGYYPRIDEDGIFTVKEITNTAITQSYIDAIQIVNFSPDDSFSDYTNQVIISGEERTFIEILHAEERIETISGTIGWWGDREEHTTYYSPDQQRTARNARLEVLMKASSIGFKLAGKVTEGIDHEDVLEHYVVTYIDVPPLIYALAAAIGTATSAIFIGDINIHPFGGGGKTDSIITGRGIFGVALMFAMNILASVVNYQHQIWAQPIGKIRRSIQAVADDADLQAELGFTVAKKFDDPLCNTVVGCQFVADFELMVAKLQRKRIRFTKVSDLLFSDGDKIIIQHPYTGQELTVFITQITRRMLIGKIDGQGYFLDDIEGWVL